VVGFAPDTGHIEKGGMDVIEIFKSYKSLIKHVHFKDITESSEWTAMGNGIIDFRQIVRMLKDFGYAGWIMVEEESPLAEADPDTARPRMENTSNKPYFRWLKINLNPKKRLIFVSID